MQTIHELVTLECENEHDLEHTLEHKRQFSEPKIFDANGDLGKRWYVYFSYRNPISGKLQRQKNIYGKANRFKTKSERYAILNLYKKRLSKLLKEGYSPYTDNAELHQKKVDQESNLIKQTNSLSQVEVDIRSNKKPQFNNDNQRANSITVKQAFDEALLLKTNIVSKTTLRDYQSRLHRFQNWLSENYKTVACIDQVSKKIVLAFLNTVQLNTSVRNRNNYRTVLSSIFQVLEDNELIDKNFVPQIKTIRTKPKRHKSYSLEEQQEIFKYLETNDKLLLLYIKFISYNLLRPIEVCRLRVKDINFNQKTLQFQAKNKILKTKIIPDILMNEIPDLNALDDNYLLFTPEGIGRPWNTELISRRDYFSKRFKTVIKDHFGFNENYGLYSFRHTFITKLYRALKQNNSPYEAKSKLMQITGHNTMSALEKYLRDIDAELPDDYSKLL